MGNSSILPHTQAESSGTQLVTPPSLVSGSRSSCVALFSQDKSSPRIRLSVSAGGHLGAHPTISSSFLVVSPAGLGLKHLPTHAFCCRLFRADVAPEGRWRVLQGQEDCTGRGRGQGAQSGLWGVGGRFWFSRSQISETGRPLASCPVVSLVSLGRPSRVTLGEHWGV